ncbi:MAG: aminopeptidase N, partial [Parvularculaceae bacterium]|nr:aminopeptidase N [Parvularculaceae bacterium]
MKTDAAPQPVRLADYAPPDYLIDRADLAFALDPSRTVVRSGLSIRRRPGAAPAPLVLNGEEIELLSLSLDGARLSDGDFARTDETLTIAAPPESFTLDIETACAPAANAALSGLYLSNGMFCTQCEAEGFRRITYFLDRPDVLARYRVRIEADRAAAPVLLSNGNPVDAGDLPGGRHFAVWDDPFPKPSYLFALVGGDLAAVEDSFTTRSGRRVALKVFVQKENAGRCGYTLDSLKRAMRWDEEAFGREYDLDLFMIVAVDHFNFGAMENKGLNIFNAAYVLASPETATDADYEAIESIVAHEYFHNWSGNRVTCRDWFQLCLKEGFTVFRDQEFSADMRSRAVQRIKDVRGLWSAQFPEDAGPLAHPVRPSSYLTIDNFYTATVYEKGAELCRMLKTLLGPVAFRKACDLYFKRHDGEAATVEDFMAAMEDASGRDLAQFWRWYREAGTPALAAEERFDPADGSFVLSLTQTIPPVPGQSDDGPRVVPIAYALYGAQSGAVLDSGLIEMTDRTLERRFGPFTERPVASLLQGFSAPVVLKRSLPLEGRLALARRDQDHFNRWAATDALWRDLALGAASLRPDFEAAVAG